MDADLSLDADPFENDPEGYARWALDCVAIERSIRDAFRREAQRTASMHHAESGVFPAADPQLLGLDPVEDTFDGLV